MARRGVVVAAVTGGVVLVSGVAVVVALAAGSGGGGDASPDTAQDRSAAGGPATRGKAPKPGTYRYGGAGGGDRADFVVTVEADGSGAGLVHQILTIPFGSGPSGRAALRTNIVWSSKGASWQHSEFRVAGLAPSCDWKPATVEYRFPLSVGASWDTDSTCSGSAVGQTASIHRVEQARVTGTAEDRVGDETVRTWVIERTTTLTTATSLGPSRTDQTVTVEHFAPDRGLFVYRQDRVGDATTELTLR